MQALNNVPCTDGKADEYQCSKVDLLSFVPLKELGSNSVGNDIWGWTDLETGHEYAILWGVPMGHHLNFCGCD